MIEWRWGCVSQARLPGSGTCAATCAMGCSSWPRLFLDRCLRAWSEGDYSLAREACEESLAIRRGLGDKKGIAWALIHLATTALSEGEYARALTLSEESLAIGRALRDMGAVGDSLDYIGRVALK